MTIRRPTYQWLLLGCTVIVLLMMLAYPFGYDQALYAIGGELSVKNGSLMYRDFLDMKSPLIFFIYGVSSLIFGHHEWSVRAFDILYHAFSLFIFYRILLKWTGDEGIAFGSVILYVLFYTTAGFWNTAQTESFAFLPSILLVHVCQSWREKDSPRKNGLYAGIAGAVLALIKLTFIIIPIAALLYSLSISTGEKRKEKFIFAGYFLAALIVLCGGYLFYLRSMGALDRFFAAVRWLQGYSDISPMFSSGTIAILYYKIFPSGLIVTFGFTGLIIGIIGIFIVFGKKQVPSVYSHLAIQLFFGLLIILLERKYFPYHYLLLLWAATPFIALGLREVSLRGVSVYKRFLYLSWFPKLLRIFLLAGVAGIALFYTPIPRLLSQQGLWLYSSISGKAPGEILEYRQGQDYSEPSAAADTLRRLMRTGDKVFLWGNGASLYFGLNVLPTTICITNTMFETSWTPPEWKNTLIAQLQSSPPELFVVEFGDARPYITGDTLDSRRHLELWKDLNDFVRQNYHRQTTIGKFEIYRRL